MRSPEDTRETFMLKLYKILSKRKSFLKFILDILNAIFNKIEKKYLLFSQNMILYNHNQIKIG